MSRNSKVKEAENAFTAMALSFPQETSARNAFTKRHQRAMQEIDGELSQLQQQLEELVTVVKRSKTIMDNEHHPESINQAIKDTVLKAEAFLQQLNSEEEGIDASVRVRSVTMLGVQDVEQDEAQLAASYRETAEMDREIANEMFPLVVEAMERIDEEENEGENNE